MPEPIDHVLLTNTSLTRKRDRDCVDSMQELRYYKGNSAGKSLKRQNKHDVEDSNLSKSIANNMYISDVDEDVDDHDKRRKEESRVVKSARGEEDRMDDEGNTEVITRLSYSLFYIESVIKAVQQLPQDHEFSFMEVIKHIYDKLEDEVSLDDFETEKCHLTKHVYNIIKSKLVKGFSRVRHGYYTYSPNVSYNFPHHNQVRSLPSNIDELDVAKKEKEDVISIEKGEYSYNDGTKYIGETLQGRKHGYGLFIKCNGDKIEGNWVNDEVRGPAILIKKDGSVFEGTWEDGGMTGYGTSESSRMNYKGFWKEGRLHGEGKCSYKDGKVIEGTFRCGSLYEGYITDPASKSSACIKEGKFHRMTKFLTNPVSEEREVRKDNVEVKKTSDESTLPPPQPPIVAREEVNGSSSSSSNDRSTSSFDRQRIILVNMKKLLDEQLIDNEDYKAVKDSLLSEYISSTISKI